ncbi:hypothetical protein PCANC_28590 [Puccinia coronata f. sp. avenae]|uniref:Uncharacterized protein n=1 Tax=Puccinia coronata f. sp. avenae TaxID=200324 RepID=A0A2N5RVS8_9BASI|nr:hypothetical protein PCANC_28590 [Puccinia coronata f. sp. avenae]
MTGTVIRQSSSNQGPWVNLEHPDNCRPTVSATANLTSWALARPQVKEAQGPALLGTMV